MTKFDFRKFPGLSAIERNQLGGVQYSLTDDPHQKRTVLVNQLLLPQRYDPVRGIYTPLSDIQNLYRKMPVSFMALPQEICPLVGSHLQNFTNALVLPEGWKDHRYDLAKAAAPKLRVTNSGILIVTHEFDPQYIPQFQEILAWTRSGGKFSLLDKALCRFREYRGFSTVYSGSRSIHFHFIFDTKHLENVPFDADRAHRDANRQIHSAIMTNVHILYWNQVWDLLSEILSPSFESDGSLEWPTWWKRLPWGNRLHTVESKVFKFPAGTVVPQMVIAEHVRERAAKGNQGFLVPPHYSLANPPVRSSKSSTGDQHHNYDGGSVNRIIDELQIICSKEWGAYPKPVQIKNDGGEWVIYFQNSADDAKPSTLVKGEYHRLLLKGHHNFTKDFFLPEDITAQDLVQDLALRFHLIRPVLSKAPEPAKKSSIPARPKDFLGQFKRGIEGAFSARALDDVEKLKSTYRRNLRPAISTARSLITDQWQDNAGRKKSAGDYVMIAPEGVSKTSSHFVHLILEGLDAAMAMNKDNNPTQRFSAIACASLAQAAEKAAELRQHPESRKLAGGVVIRSFWKHYEEVCAELETQPIRRSGFHSGKFHDIYQQIADEQPQVFAALESIRHNLWRESRFDCGLTIICTTHATLHSWHHSRATRIWHHPGFRPGDAEQDHEVLRRQFALSRVVYDEINIDDLIYFLSEEQHHYFETQQRKYSDWRNMSRPEREAVFGHCKATSRIVTGEFESFNELMRLDLTVLSRVTVDFDPIPYMASPSDKCIYRRCHGDAYYVGFRSWMFETDIQYGFLTTEELVTKVLETSYRKQKQTLLRLDLDHMPGIFPIPVPVLVEPRAQKRKVAELAKERLRENPNSHVIANHCGAMDGVTTFQSMKGANHLANTNTSIIYTMLNAFQFSMLNVIGQWLELHDIIEMYDQDFLNQAVGRNQGFRHHGAQATIIVNRRMLKHNLSQLNRPKTRFRMYRV